MKSRATDLYRHYDADGKLLYVGISLAPLDRLRSHKSQSAWFRDIRKITIEPFANRDLAEEAEICAIETEFPLHNLSHNPRAEKLLPVRLIFPEHIIAALRCLASDNKISFSEAVARILSVCVAQEKVKPK